MQLDLQQKMLPKSSDNLIYCHSGCGPIFGGDDDDDVDGDSCDLGISDNCNTSNSSIANFPTTYNIEGPSPYTNGQSSYTAFSGATSNCSFKVAEYEVFQVVYY